MEEQNASRHGRGFIALAVFFLIATAMIALQIYGWPYTIDDAYILIRYADHLGRGLGLVWNIGESPPVEGFTCFLWTLLLTPIVRLPGEAIVLAKGATMLASVLLLWLVWQSSKWLHKDSLSKSSLWHLAPVAVVGLFPGMVLHGASALETVPYTVFIVAGLLMFSREQDRGGKPWIPWSALLLACAAMTRPEGVMAAVPCAIALLWRVKNGAARRRQVLSWFGLYAMLLTLFFTFRRLYFLAWLPNTYYTKVGGLGVEDRFIHGLRYILSCLATMAGSHAHRNMMTATHITLAAVVGIILAGACFLAVRRGLEGRILCGVFVLFTGAIIYEGGDWMPMCRMFVPVLPLAVLVIAAGFCELNTRGYLRKYRAEIRLSVVVLPLLGAGYLYTIYYERNHGRGWMVNAEGNDRVYRSLAEYIRDNAGQGDSLAMMDIGYMGYVNRDLDIIDISGLVDRTIARAPGGFLTKRYDPAYILEQHPRFMILVPDVVVHQSGEIIAAPQRDEKGDILIPPGWAREGVRIVPGLHVDRSIASHPDFARAYRFVLAYNHRANWQPRSDYWLCLFKKVLEED
ncbi:hypothetical protein ACFLU6_08540 [Acidobacteriota bacterium]